MKIVGATPVLRILSKNEQNMQICLVFDHYYFIEIRNDMIRFLKFPLKNRIWSGD